MSLLKIDRPKEIYLIVACSGFELESPVHFRTWTWRAGNTTLYLRQCFDKYHPDDDPL